VSVATPAATTFAAILEQLQADSQQYFGTSSATCEPLWMRDGLFGSVMRLAAHTGRGDVILYAKIFKPRNDTPEELERQHSYMSTEFERTREARHAFADISHLAVPRPVACFPEHLAIVAEEAQGVGLNVILKRLALRRTRAAREAAFTALERVGEWLRVFQASIPANPAERKDYRRYLDRRLRALVRHAAITERDREVVLAFFDAQWALVPDEQLNPVAVHADLCPANILVAPDCLTVIDLAASLDRARYLDVAHLYMHLAIAGERMHLGRALTSELQQTLLRAFDPALTSEVPLFRLMLLQNAIVHHLFLVESPPGPLARLATVFRGSQARRARQWSFGLAGVAA